MRKSFFIFYFLFFILSCKEKNKKDSEFKNDRLYRHSYYKEGGLKSSTPFINDSIIDGVQSLFYLNGKIQAKISWVNGKRLGSVLEYYNNGKIKSYKFCNLEEAIIYQRDYDTSGSIVQERGEIFPLSITDVNKFNKENILYSDIYIMQIPNSEVFLEFFLINNKDTIRVHFNRAGDFVRLNEKINSKEHFKEFAIKQFIKDFDKGKQWDDTYILSLK